MSGFNEETVESVVAACRQNTAALAESLKLNVGFENSLEVGEPRTWDPDAISSRFDGPGIVVVIELGGQAAVCLLPATLPIPEWYAAPSMSESAQLQTIAMEWGLNLLPEVIEHDRAETLPVDNLRDSLVEARPAEGAVVLELLVKSAASDNADATSSPETAPEDDAADEATIETADETAEEVTDAVEDNASILIVLPVENPPQQAEQSAGDDSKSSSETTSPPDNSTAAAAAPPAVGNTRVNRLLPLPVAVSVRLAEKKIEMGTLLNLAPGVLVKFNKSCDDYLDLYVNNFRYCRGEAIKIGEKFGMKVKDVGAVVEPEERILQPDDV